MRTEGYIKYVDEKGTLVESFSNSGNDVLASGRYFFVISHGRKRLISIWDKLANIIWTKEMDNPFYVPIEMTKDTATKPDLSRKAALAYNLDSAVNAVFRWQEGDKGRYECKVPIRIYLDKYGYVDIPNMNIDVFHCKAQSGGLSSEISIKLALNELPKHIPALDRDGKPADGFLDTVLHLKAPPPARSTRRFR